MRCACLYMPASTAVHYAIPTDSYVCWSRPFGRLRWLVSICMGGVMDLHAEHVVNDFGSLVQVSPWH